MKVIISFYRFFSSTHFFSGYFVSLLQCFFIEPSHVRITASSQYFVILPLVEI